jgi:hypothetical protein
LITARYRYADGSVTEVVSMAENGVVKVEITHSTIGTVGIVEAIFTPAVNMAESVNIAPPASSPPVTPPQSLLAPPPASDPGEAGAELTLAAAAPKKHRGLSAFIRGAWTLIFGVAGEAAVYVLDNLGILNLPPGAGVAVGAVLYSIKKYAKPEGLL